MGRYDHDMPVFTSDGRGGAKKRPASTTRTTPKRRWEPRTAGAETEAWINADILGGEKVQEQLAATKRWQEMERHHVDGIMTSGMTAPTFIRTDTNVRAMQGALGVKEDGVWGPETDAAFSARLAQEEAAAVAELQRLYREAGGTPPQERYYKQSRIDPEIVGKYMTAGERDEDRASTSARRPPAVVYGTTPRPIPEAAGAVTRGLNTLEGINRAYDQIIAEKEAAWRSLDTRGVNPRSQEGRALTQEKGALYIEWKRAEREQAKAVAAWYRARNEAAYAQSPDALIDVAVEDAREAMRNQGYSNNSYPKNRKAYDATQLFSAEEKLFTYMGSMLNYWSAESNQEHMCNIYSIHLNDGTTEYIAGPVYTGKHDNVILPYLLYSSGEAGLVELSEEYAGVDIQYEGMLHSHPYCSGHENDKFSSGDAAVALLSGRIWLTAPNGTVYALERGRAVEAFGASLFRDTAFGKTNKGTIDAIRASEKYLVPNVSGYDVTQDCQQVDDRRWR